MSKPKEQKKAEQRWPKLDPDHVMDEAAKALALGVVERAVIDWKELCPKIPKRKLCTEEIERRKVMFDEIRSFLRSEWCSRLLGNTVRRSKMLEELELRYAQSAFVQQAQAYEAGDAKC